MPCLHCVLQKSILRHENQAVYECGVNEHAAAPTAHDKKAQGNALGNGHAQLASPERAKHGDIPPARILRRKAASSTSDTRWRLMRVMRGRDFVTPFQGSGVLWDVVPRALPWAFMFLRFQRATNGFSRRIPCKEIKDFHPWPSVAPSSPSSEFQKFFAE